MRYMDLKSESLINFAIITVTLNDSEQLMRTHESLENQTYTNWIHIVIDGKSSSIHDFNLNKLRNKKNTILVSELDHGIYFAMNKGWMMAPEESHLVFLNSGDTLINVHTLELVANEILQNDCPDFVVAPIEQTDVDKNLWVCLPLANPSIQNQLFAYGYVSHQGVFMSKSFMRKLGGFDTSLRVASDWDLIVRGMEFEKPYRLKFPVSHFRTGGFSTVNIELAHEELRKLRRRYMHRTNFFYLYEFIWTLVYLRNHRRFRLFRVILFAPMLAAKFSLKLSLIVIHFLDPLYIFSKLTSLKWLNKGDLTEFRLVTLALEFRKRVITSTIKRYVRIRSKFAFEWEPLFHLWLNNRLKLNPVWKDIPKKGGDYDENK